MKKKNVMMIAMMFSVFTTATALTAGAQEIQAGTEETRAAQEMQSGSGEAEKAGTYVLPVKELTKKSVDENPYMAKGDTNIHTIRIRRMRYCRSVFIRKSMFHMKK